MYFLNGEGVVDMPIKSNLIEMNRIAYTDEFHLKSATLAVKP